MTKITKIEYDKISNIINKNKPLTKDEYELLVKFNDYIDQIPKMLKCKPDKIETKIKSIVNTTNDTIDRIVEIEKAGTLYTAEEEWEKNNGIKK